MLDSRGYCARTSLCAYSLGVPNYKITFPSKSYPSTAPYTTLSNYFKTLAKEGLLHRLVVKALLYPEFIHRINIDSVRLRRNHRTTSFRRRQSICSSTDLSQHESENNDACETSATSSISFVRYFPNKPSTQSSGSESSFIDHGPGVAVDCTREIFACIESSRNDSEKKVSVLRESDGSLIFTHEDCDTGRDSLKYYTKPVKVVIDRGPIKSVDSFIHTTTAQMFIGGGGGNEKEDMHLHSKGSPSDDSILSEYDQRSIRANMACEDLVNLDDSMKIKCDKSELSKKPPTVDERHSMPTLFVGNRFNCSSLTEVFIPSYKEKLEMKSLENNSSETLEDCNESQSNRHSNTSTATHSSSVDIPPIVPAPDQLSIELLYNPNGSPPDNSESHHFVIKPPSMFDGRKTLSKDLTAMEQRSVSQRNSSNVLRLEAGDKRSISFQHIADQNTTFPSAQNKQNNDKTLDPKRKCGCCVQAHSPCVSQRSSDSGMAGSCTISPDAPISNTENEFDPLDERFLPAIEQRLNSLMHSQSSQNFGLFQNIPFADSNHDSGQYGCNDESENEHRDSNAVKNMFELSSSQGTVRRKSRCQSVEPQTENTAEEPDSEEIPKIYRTGMYAHWWKKQQLPSAMLKDIYRMKTNKVSNSTTRQPTDNRGSGKLVYDLVGFSLCCSFISCYCCCTRLTNSMKNCFILSHSMISFDKFVIF